ncbi:hypothetical protein PR048_029851 [Dryococelus australis]|uniref:Uncharacterized protein n=1 Tax=Dryococelus australis TaxID=614101 RepID=A0ABQ9G7B5_9NEOP|nr:hypothetical protein PR048_029851 [Dryococelus australis]
MSDCAAIKVRSPVKAECFGYFKSNLLSHSKQAESIENCRYNDPQLNKVRFKSRVLGDWFLMPDSAQIGHQNHQKSLNEDRGGYGSTSRKLTYYSSARRQVYRRRKYRLPSWACSRTGNHCAAEESYFVVIKPIIVSSTKNCDSLKLHSELRKLPISYFSMQWRRLFHRRKREREREKERKREFRNNNNRLPTGQDMSNFGQILELMCGNLPFPRDKQSKTTSHVDLSHVCNILYVVFSLRPLTRRARCDDQQRHTQTRYLPALSSTYSHGCPIAWPARSPDLTPLEYLL